MATQYDYESIRLRILNNLSAKTEHQNVFNNGAIVNIIEAISEELEDEMLQDEYLTTENNWELAQNKSSLLTESKVHNYDVPRKRGATGNIRFGVTSDFLGLPTEIVDFPKWTQISDDNGVDFTTIESTSLPITEPYVDILTVQGVHKTFTTFATGIDNESFIIINDSIENNNYDLYVNDILWSSVSTLFDYGGNDNVYEIRSLTDFSGIKLLFGEGIYGKILSDGDEIRLEYVETLGTEGNIILNNSVTTVDSTIFNINGDQVEVFCTNPSAIAGGESEASLEEIRTDSPRFFQSGDRATAKEDYETIINGFSYIKKVSVTGAYEYNLDNGNDLWTYIPTQDNVVQVNALTTTDEGLSESQQIQLTTDIREKNAPTDILTYPEISIIPMRFNMDISVSTRALTLNQVKTNIDTALEANYSIDVLNFFESIFKSDYYNLIDDVEGVRKHSTYVSLLDIQDFTSAYARSINLPLFPILSGTAIKVYTKLKIEADSEYVLIGQGDVDGFIIGEIGYTFTALSRIDLVTGIGTMAITDGLTDPFADYDVMVDYQLSSEDVQLTSRSQILKYNNSNYINIDYYRGG